MKNKIIVLLLVAFIFLTTGFKKITLRDKPPEKWTGRITWKKTSATTGKKKWDNHGLEEAHRWDISFEYKIDAVFVKSKGNVHRHETATDWQKDSLVFVHPEKKYLIGETTKWKYCDCSEILDVEVEFDADRKNYWVRFDMPICDQHDEYLKISNLYGNQNDVSINEHPGTTLTLPPTFSGQPVGNNLKTLSGSWQETIPSPNDGGVMITTANWDLSMICPPWNNPMTQNNIATLDQRVRAAAAKFVKRVNDELCIKLKVTSAYRSKQDQDALYAQGRTKPGRIVTNARGGQSNHNSGKAIDVYMVLEDGSIATEDEVPPEVVKIAKEEGFEWGGSWKGKLRDGPHFEYVH